MFEGWELPTSHCMVTAVGKGIDRAHGKSEVRPKVRKPLSWELLTKGRGCVAGVETEGWVVWCGLDLSFHLLCRASEIWAFGNGLVHPDFCLTRRDLVFFAGASQLAWDDRRIADRVEVTFRASKSDNKRLGATVTRTSVTVGKDQATRGVSGYGALEIILDLLDLHPELSGSAPLMQTRTASGWKVISRAVATKALRRMVSSLGRDPTQYALHSEEKEIVAMMDVRMAYEGNDLAKFECTLHDKRNRITDDPFVMTYLGPLRQRIRESVHLHLCRPYNKITMTFMARELNLRATEVEALLIDLILDRRSYGKIDQIEGYLLLEGSKETSTSRKHDAMERWSNSLRSLTSHVVHRVNYQ
eukprot:jgi/Undpi1/13406/HiC_scaffold_8.g03065.m1